MYNFLKGRLIVVRLALLAAGLALVAIGIATIYAVGHPVEAGTAGQGGALSHYWRKQVIFAVVGALGFLAANIINYRRLGAMSYWIYGFVLLLLGTLLFSKYVVELPFAQPINYTYRWIKLSIAGKSLPAVQPSEFCKIGYILALAWYLRYRSNYRNLSALVGPFALTVLPMVLILLEPDLGTVLLMMPILFTMVFVAGAKVKHLVMIVLMAALVSPLLWYKMEYYQRIRISSVLLQNRWVQQKAEEHPALGKILVGKEFSSKQWQDDWGYHLMRSKFAVASGGVRGYGYRKGPFIKYDFLTSDVQT
jgi:cell division protein FtsW (lipid II flippase)